MRKKHSINYQGLLKTIGIATIIVLLGGYELTIAAQVDAPQVVTKDGQETLLLPDKLLESIKTNFPGFRVPATVDIVGAWLDEKKPGLFPFITWGDYNGDGLTDVAIILISDKESKLVIFHKTAQDYTPAYKAGREIRKEGGDIQYPQEMTLATWPGGVEKTVEVATRIKPSYEHTTVYKYKFKLDVLRSGYFEQGVTLIYWENGVYKSTGFGSS